MSPTRRANGEGTVYKRQDGRWEGAAFVLTSAGVRERRRVYGRTREEAHRAVTKLVRQSHQGLPVAATAQSVEQYLTYWINEVARHRVRPLTFRTYEMFVREHLIPSLGKKRLHRLTARDIRFFLNSKREVSSRSPGNEAKPLAARTIFHLHAVLRNALEHAVREDLLPRNVARQVQVSPGRGPDVSPLTVDEAHRLLAAATSNRLYALYAVSLSLGLRRGEALGLPWSNVDLDGQILRIRQTLQRFDGQLHFAPPKTRRSERSIPLPDELKQVLLDHRARQEVERAGAGLQWKESGLVFTTMIGTPIEPNEFSRYFRVLAAKAGLSNVRLHDLRHTCASMLLAQGVPPRVVMEILGHSSLDVTMNIYGHVMLDAQRDALRGMGGLLR